MLSYEPTKVSYKQPRVSATDMSLHSWNEYFQYNPLMTRWFVLILNRGIAHSL
ncbi:hypothetical protein BV22DRAFT_807113 [Leucogyrophana mollusca]|uniref:Uncharacterized protein n=1 Tax=Leucogyrophana mollusca TaxID=85980 RepID=A0ACB8B3S2_9AGAM|nr:hypothetical protein BV22DRAFT_807113 [Leucogyrophana mollusca]